MTFKDPRFNAEDNCVAWDSFCTAVFVWVQMNEAKRPTVADAAAAFSTNEDDVMTAINYWHGGLDIAVSRDGVLSIVES